MSDNERQFHHMWQWIAEETRRQKRRVEKFEYFIAFGIPRWERPCCDCYACKEGMQRVRDNSRDGGMRCSYCPIDWGNCAGEGNCTEKGTLYDEWEHAYSYEDTAELAEQIAQLEWRDKDAR